MKERTDLFSLLAWPSVGDGWKSLALSPCSRAYFNINGGGAVREEEEEGTFPNGKGGRGGRGGGRKAFSFSIRAQRTCVIWDALPLLSCLTHSLTSEFP